MREEQTAKDAKDSQRSQGVLPSVEVRSSCPRAFVEALAVIVYFFQYAACDRFVLNITETCHGFLSPSGEPFFDDEIPAATGYYFNAVTILAETGDPLCGTAGAFYP